MLPTGSHKVNTAILQAYYALVDGVEGVTTETGAEQWGSAVALAASLYGLKSYASMVRVSFEHKPGRRFLIQAPLGIAISKAVEYGVMIGMNSRDLRMLKTDPNEACNVLKELQQNIIRVAENSGVDIE